MANQHLVMLCAFIAFLCRMCFQFRMHEESVSVADEYFELLYKLTDDLVKHITDVNHTHAEL